MQRNRLLPSEVVYQPSAQTATGKQERTWNFVKRSGSLVLPVEMSISFSTSTWNFMPTLWEAIQGMNAYGIILNDIGMEPLIDELQQLASISSSLWKATRRKQHQEDTGLKDFESCFEDNGLRLFPLDSMIFWKYSHLFSWKASAAAFGSTTLAGSWKLLGVSAKWATQKIQFADLVHFFTMLHAVSWFIPFDSVCL